MIRLAWRPLLLVAALVLSGTSFARFRAETLCSLGLFAVFVVFHAGYGSWPRGVSWGPPNLAALVPFALLPLAALLERLSDAGLVGRAAVEVDLDADVGIGVAPIVVGSLGLQLVCQLGHLAGLRRWFARLVCWGFPRSIVPRAVHSVASNPRRA